MSEVYRLYKNKKAFVAIIVIVIFILNIESVINGTIDALNICATAIIPSLFIFMVAADMIVTTLFSDKGISFPPKFTAYILGSLCGFPVGASVCENMCKNKALSKRDAARIIPFCNNTSPSFLLGAIGTVMFGDKRYGIILFIAQTVASAFPLLFIKTQKSCIIHVKNNVSVLEAFVSAIEKAVMGVLKVCANVCIFSVIITLLKKLSLDFLSVFLEISNGTTYCAEIFSAHPIYGFALCGFCCGFSGFCVHMQIKSMLKYVEISMPNLLFSKLLQGLFCGLLSAIGYYLFI